MFFVGEIGTLDSPETSKRVFSEEGMLRFLIGLTCVLWAVCFFAQSSPTPIATGSTAKVVCKSESEEVVLHATTSAALPIVDILPCGAELTVVSKQAGWYRVRTKGGKEGYVKDTFFATPPPQSVNAQPQDAATLEAQYTRRAPSTIFRATNARRKSTNN